MDKRLGANLARRKTGKNKHGVEYQSEEEKEAMVGQCLRSWPFLKTLNAKKPLFESWLQKTHWGQKSFRNRWHADEAGIVVHYPDSIHVTGRDFGEFQEIGLSYADFCVDYAKGESVNLLVTRDLICLEFRISRDYGRANVYHRRSLEMVYCKDKFLGHFSIGEYRGKEELFYKEFYEPKEVKNCIVKIDHWGEEETVWDGYASCDCVKKGEYRAIKLFLNRSNLLRFCFWCNRGMFENTVTGSVTEPYFNFHHPRKFLKSAVSWFHSSKIVGIEERSKVGDVLRSFGLVNTETGQPELVFSTIDGDFFRCYAVSPKYLVICFRNWKLARPNKNEWTHMIVKNRDTKETREFQVPEFVDMIESLKIVSNSILIAMPRGTTVPESGITHEHVSSMDLDDKDPCMSMKSFKVPVSEVRPFGVDKIICKITGAKEDEFVVYSLL